MIDKKYIKSLAKSIIEKSKEETQKKVKISFSSTERHKEILKKNNVDIGTILGEFVDTLCEELEEISSTKKAPTLEEKVQARVEEKKFSFQK